MYVVEAEVQIKILKFPAQMNPFLSGRHHVVCLVPHPLVQQPQTGLQLGGHVLVQPGDGVALHLQHVTLLLGLLYNVCSYIEVMCSLLYFFEIF